MLSEPDRGTLGGETSVTEQIDHSKLAEMTAEIVSAYVSHNRVPLSDVSVVIKSVATRLGSLGEAEEQAANAKPEPVVAIRRSVGKDHITCLLCGKRQKLLKRHLATAHDLTPGQYREMFELRPDYPMAAPSYVQQRSEIARRTGLGRPKEAPPRRKRAAKRATK
jgi:predicted transcriptional regulator